MKKILIAYEDRHHPVEMDISERSQTEVQKIKEVLKRVGWSWQERMVKDSN